MHSQNGKQPSGRSGEQSDTKIADALEIGRQEVIQMADRIRKLNPCPGAAFAHKEQQYIIADITVEKANGEYLVLINDISAPRNLRSTLFTGK